MAISLSNHEDRIKKLEESIVSSGKLSALDIGNVASSYNLSDVADNALHLISFNGLWNENDGYGERNVICCVPWIKNHYLQNLQCLGGSNFGYGAYIEIKSNIISIKPNNGSNGRMNSMRIITLKLYYNFSYNIYRLTVSISKSFLKCLIKIRN